VVTRAWSAKIIVRTSDYNIIDGIINSFDKNTILELFRRANLCRTFEICLRQLMQKREFHIPIYLSVGQEFVAAAVSMTYTNCSIFAQHRSHSWYLSYGGNIEALIDELLGKESGCCGGMGGSASIHDQNIKMFGHDGLLGDQIPIAVGFALSGEKVLTVAGDAAIEEDYALGAMGFAASKNLNILFVCEDNDLSILTPVKVRRSWNICDIAKAFDIKYSDISDDPWTVMTILSNIQNPYLLNIKTCRELWHVGCGQDTLPEWDRYNIVKNQISQIGLKKEMNEIEEQNNIKVNDLWEKHLPK